MCVCVCVCVEVHRSRSSYSVSRFGFCQILVGFDLARDFFFAEMEKSVTKRPDSAEYPRNVLLRSNSGRGLIVCVCVCVCLGRVCVFEFVASVRIKSILAKFHITPFSSK